IEENAFQDNQTGALGLHASNLTIINNQFAHNYINPDDAAGGTVFVRQCSDPVTISGNTLRGPDDMCPGGVCSVNTFGLELFGRNTMVTGNTIYNYPHEGIEANSVYKLTIN